MGPPGGPSAAPGLSGVDPTFTLSDADLDGAEYTERSGLTSGQPRERAPATVFDISTDYSDDDALLDWEATAGLRRTPSWVPGFLAQRRLPDWWFKSTLRQRRRYVAAGAALLSLVALAALALFLHARGITPASLADLLGGRQTELCAWSDDARLPDAVVPSAYELAVTVPSLREGAAVTGSVRVTVTPRFATRCVVLNAGGMQVTSASVKEAAEEQPKSHMEQGGHDDHDQHGEHEGHGEEMGADHEHDDEGGGNDASGHGAGRRRRLTAARHLHAAASARPRAHARRAAHEGHAEASATAAVPRTFDGEVTLRPEAEQVILHFPESLVAGRQADIELSFTYPLVTALEGFYRSPYGPGGSGANGTDPDTALGATQFEVAGARRAFPCFDEPGMKATFAITVLADPSLLVLSNMPVRAIHRHHAADAPAESGHDGDSAIRGDSAPARQGHEDGESEGQEEEEGREALAPPSAAVPSADAGGAASPPPAAPHTDLASWHFAATPPMSTYLVAWVVGNLTRSSTQILVRRGPGGATATEGGADAGATSSPAAPPASVNVTCWGARGRSEGGLEFGARAAAAALASYERALGVPYPLPKLDLVAVPDFAAGAMENWGLITFREADLLVTEAGEDGAGVGGHPATDRPWDGLSGSWDPASGDPAAAAVAAAAPRFPTGRAARERVASVVAHEVAHMWFGDLVSFAFWDDLWLAEGFATYLQYQGAAEALGHEHRHEAETKARAAGSAEAEVVAAGRAAFGRAIEASYEAFYPDNGPSSLAASEGPDRHPLGVADPSLTVSASEGLFDAISYDLGAAFLRQTRAWMGARARAAPSSAPAYLGEGELGSALPGGLAPYFALATPDTDPFLAFLHHYLSSEAYGTSTTADLWADLDLFLRGPGAAWGLAGGAGVAGGGLGLDAPDASAAGDAPLPAVPTAEPAPPASLPAALAEWTSAAPLPTVLLFRDASGRLSLRQGGISRSGWTGCEGEGEGDDLLPPSLAVAPSADEAAGAAAAAHLDAPPPSGTPSGTTRPALWIPVPLRVGRSPPAPASGAGAGSTGPTPAWVTLSACLASPPGLDAAAPAAVPGQASANVSAPFVLLNAGRLGAFRTAYDAAGWEALARAARQRDLEGEFVIPGVDLGGLLADAFAGADAGIADVASFLELTRSLATRELDDAGAWLPALPLLERVARLAACPAWERYVRDGLIDAWLTQDPAARGGAGGSVHLPLELGEGSGGGSAAAGQRNATLPPAYTLTGTSEAAEASARDPSAFDALRPEVLSASAAFGDPGLLENAPGLLVRLVALADEGRAAAAAAVVDPALLPALFAAAAASGEPDAHSALVRAATDEALGLGPAARADALSALGLAVSRRNEVLASALTDAVRRQDAAGLVTAVASRGGPAGARDAWIFLRHTWREFLRLGAGDPASRLELGDLFAAVVRRLSDADLLLDVGIAQAELQAAGVPTEALRAAADDAAANVRWVARNRDSVCAWAAAAMA